jgi:predicted DNA-binding protein
MGEIPLDEAPRVLTDAAHDAARGQVVYLTEHGERLAAIVPTELAAELENLGPEQFRELLEDFADAQVAREALAELKAGAEPIAANDVWMELGLSAQADTEELEQPGQANSRDVVQRSDGKWQVVKPGGRRPSAVVPTQKEAIQLAREILNREGGGELRIHSTGGAIRDQRTIVSSRADSYPPKA